MQTIMLHNELTQWNKISHFVENPKKSDTERQLPYCFDKQEISNIYMNQQDVQNSCD